MRASSVVTVKRFDSEETASTEVVVVAAKSTVGTEGFAMQLPCPCFETAFTAAKGAGALQHAS